MTAKEQTKGQLMAEHPLTDEQRAELQNSYVNQLIDDMDLNNLIQYVSDSLHDYLDKESDEELIDIVKELYPELLNDT